MTWTTDVPAVPGHYWFRDGGREYRDIVMVMVNPDGPPVVEYQEPPAHDHAWRPVSLAPPGSLWAGPIPEPEPGTPIAPPEPSPTLPE